MDDTKLTVEEVQQQISTAIPGTVITLPKGSYGESLVFENKHGKDDKLITLTGDSDNEAYHAILDGGMEFADFNPDTNRIVYEIEQRGIKEFEKEEDRPYPGLHHIADRALLVIRNCSYLRIREFSLMRGWPTLIYIENSHHICLEDLSLVDGTFAIFCRGEDCHEIQVSNCRWVQDKSKKMLWQGCAWRQIHNPPVDPEGDFRAFDGGFFHGDKISGNVLIENNVISDAFNGIQLWSYDPDEYPLEKLLTLNRNVVIRNNSFYNIRDNAVEPERSAYNWWVYHNNINNCHKAFSLDLTVYQYVYIFGNLIWSDSRQGAPSGDDNRGGAVFKLKCRENHELLAPIYFFHNSIYSRMTYVKKRGLHHLKHFANAIEMCRPELHAHDFQSFEPNKALFGDKFLEKRDVYVGMNFSDDCFSSTWWQLEQDIIHRKLKEVTGKQSERRKLEERLSQFEFLERAPLKCAIFSDGAKGQLDLRSQLELSDLVTEEVEIELPDGEKRPIQAALPGAIQGGERFEPEFASVESINPLWNKPEWKKI